MAPFPEAPCIFPFSQARPFMCNLDFIPFHPFGVWDLKSHYPSPPAQTISELCNIFALPLLLFTGFEPSQSSWFIALPRLLANGTTDFKDPHGSAWPSLMQEYILSLVSLSCSVGGSYLWNSPISKTPSFKLDIPSGYWPSLFSFTKFLKKEFLHHCFCFLSSYFHLKPLNTGKKRKKKMLLWSLGYCIFLFACLVLFLSGGSFSFSSFFSYSPIPYLIFNLFPNFLLAIIVIDILLFTLPLFLIT